jgi:hypothetical protein
MLTNRKAVAYIKVDIILSYFFQEKVISNCVRYCPIKLTHTKEHIAFALDTFSLKAILKTSDKEWGI